jgi:hypothetical protein
MYDTGRFCTWSVSLMCIRFPLAPISFCSLDVVDARMSTSVGCIQTANKMAQAVALMICMGEELGSYFNRGIDYTD